MTRQERELFLRSIKGARNYLEFGSGGSTIAALDSLDGTSAVHSVESDGDWLLDMEQRYGAIRDGLSSGRLKLHHVDIGKVGDWGSPLDEKRKAHWPEYSAKVFEEEAPFDVVLIDAQFRGACGLRTILNTALDVVIMFHDFSMRRPDCKVLLKYLDIIEAADTLVVFKKKKKLDRKALAADYEAFKYIPRSGVNGPVE
ncbi:MAG: hypothetical protein FWD15_04305 [Alphaproteobacteria bacterium]|nr:hypothetical protein [Alphaproteobacteria bacterium]